MIETGFWNRGSCSSRALGGRMGLEMRVSSQVYVPYEWIGSKEHTTLCIPKRRGTWYWMRLSYIPGPSLPRYLQISPGWWSHVLFKFKFLQPFCSPQAYLFVIHDILHNFYGPLRNTTHKRNIEEETDSIFHETRNTRRRRWKILIFGPRESIHFIIMKVIWKKHASWAEMCSRYPS